MYSHGASTECYIVAVVQGQARPRLPAGGPSRVRGQSRGRNAGWAAPPPSPAQAQALSRQSGRKEKNRTMLTIGYCSSWLA